MYVYIYDVFKISFCNMVILFILSNAHPTPIQRQSNAIQRQTHTHFGKTHDNFKMAQASHISLWASPKDSKGCAPLFLRKAGEKCRAMVPRSAPRLGTTPHAISIPFNAGPTPIQRRSNAKFTYQNLGKRLARDGPTAAAPSSPDF